MIFRTNLRAALGLSLVELLVGIFVFTTLTTSIAGLASLGTRTAVVNEQRTVALAIAHEEAEKLKLMPYDQVGYTMKAPYGKLPHRKVMSRNGNQLYTVTYDISYMDGWPRNLGGQNNALKQVIIKVQTPASVKTDGAVSAAIVPLTVARTPAQCTACQTDADCPIPMIACDAGQPCQDGLECNYGYCQYPLASVTPQACGVNAPCPFGYQCQSGSCVTQSCLTNGPLVCMFYSSKVCLDYPKFVNPDILYYSDDCETNNWCLSASPGPDGKKYLYDCDDSDRRLYDGVAYENTTCDDLINNFKIPVQKAGTGVASPLASPPPLFYANPCPVGGTDICYKQPTGSVAPGLPICCNGACQVGSCTP